MADADLDFSSDEDMEVSDADSGFFDDNELSNDVEESHSSFSGEEDEYFEEDEFSDEDSECSDQPSGEFDQAILHHIRKDPDRAYKIMECRSCSNYCHPPFRSCESEHLICARCSKGDPELCEVCGTLKTRTEHEVLKRIHNLMVFNCVYQEHGCGFQGLGRGIVDHFSKCSYIKTSCLNSNCTWKGKPSELFGHHEIEHSDGFYGNYIAEADVDSNRKRLINKSVLMLSENKFVCLELQFFLSERKIRGAAYNLGYVKAIEEYKLEISIEKSSGGTFELLINCKNTFEYLKDSANGILFDEIYCDTSNMRKFRLHLTQNTVEMAVRVRMPERRR